MVKCLIVNADDFGMNESICKGIENCHKSGIVTSTSVMSNMPYLNLAAEIANKNSKLGVGLHINLTEGKYLTSNKQFPKSNLIKALTGRIKKEAAQSEIEAQIQAALDHGFKITHLDGHKHIHIMPKILDATIDAARNFNINKIRLPLEAQGTSYNFKQTPKKYLLKILSLNAVKKFKANRIKYPEHFYGISETGQLNEEKLKKIIKTLPEGVSELMCHPSYTNNSKLNRKGELMALTDRKVRLEMEANEIRLINYGEL